MEESVITVNGNTCAAQRNTSGYEFNLLALTCFYSVKNKPVNLAVWVDPRLLL